MLSLFAGDHGAADTLRFIEEELGVGLWTLDIKTDRMQWSSGLYTLLGLKSGSVEPSLTLLRSMMHPDDKLSRQDIDRILHEGIPINREFRIIRHDGRVRWVTNRGEAILDAAGHRERAVGLICDISDRQHALIELRSVEHRYRTLTQTVATIVWTALPNGQMTDLPVWRELTGQTVAEFQGAGWLDPLHPDDRNHVAAAHARSVAFQTPYSATYRIRLKDGTYRWFNSRAAPIFSANGTLKEWIGILINVFQGSAQDEALRWLTGAQARAARAILNWTVKQVAEAANVSVSTVRRLEENDGPSNLRGDILMSIKSALAGC